MTTIAIHQPNYLPWLGFFAKLSVVDTFVFLDDVAFSKGSYINRVQFLHGRLPRWLTIPILHKQGMLISETLPVNETWKGSHIDSLVNWYKKFPGFLEVIEEFEVMLNEASAKNTLAEINKFLIIKLARHLSLHCRFINSSELNVTTKGTERLIDIVKKIDVKAQYVSGQGGVKYQNPHKFSEAGIKLRYLDFKHPVYSQGTEEFIPGLSIMDAVFHLGWGEVKSFLENVQKSWEK